MSTGAYVMVVVAVWLALGLGAALFLGRRGYRAPTWYFLGAALGPLFVPIALERGRRVHQVVERSVPRSPDGQDGGLTVVVGVDGSPESDQVVRQGSRLFAGADVRFVLVTAVDPDVVEFHDDATRDRCMAVLAERATWLRRNGAEPVLELAAGEPGRALVDVAVTEGADVVLVGRRGQGLSHRILGSVAEHVTRHAPMPVLLSPRTPRGGDALG